MTAGANEDIPTTCPVCGTPYDFGGTGVRPTTAERDAGAEPVAEAVAYCPKPDCPSHAEGQVDDPGGA